MSELVTLQTGENDVGPLLSPTSVNITRSYGARATSPKNKGKWYCEVKIKFDPKNSYSPNHIWFGIALESVTVRGDSRPITQKNYNAVGMIRYDNKLRTSSNGSLQESIYQQGNLMEVIKDNSIISYVIDYKNKILVILSDGVLIGTTNIVSLDEESMFHIISNTMDASTTYIVDYNFGTTPFKYFTQELKNQGYLPYDLDNSDPSNLYKPNKYLFRKDNKIYQPTPGGINLVSDAVVSKKLFEQYGTEDITDLVGFDKEVIINSKAIELNENSLFESNKIEGIEISSIKAMEVI